MFELVLNDFNDFLDKNTDAETVKLEDCVEKINTGADAIQRAPMADYDTGIRCIRIGDMTNGRDYHSWGFTKMTDKDFENYNVCKLFDGKTNPAECAFNVANTELDNLFIVPSNIDLAVTETHLIGKRYSESQLRKSILKIQSQV